MSLDLQVIYTPYPLEDHLPVYADFFSPDSSIKNRKPELRFLHYHNCAELCYCRMGEGALHTSLESAFSYQAGDAVLVPAFVPHMHHVTYTGGQPNEVENDYLYVDMDQLLLSQHAALQQLSVLSFQQDCCHFAHSSHPRLCQHVAEILDELHDAADMYQLAVHGLLLTLLADIQRSCARQSYPQASNDYAAVLPALRHIMNHYAEDITVEQLADLCHISPTHLRRQFRKCVQTTPLAFLNRLRLQRSCTLLYATSRTVADIAFATGFGSISNFNKAFKERYGVSAAVWRSHAQHESP